MKKSLTAALMCGALALSFGLATAGAQDSVPASAADNTNLWFVELQGAPGADGNSLKNVRAEKAAFRKAATAAGVSYVERRSFDVLFNGFSVEVSPAQRSQLASLPGVKALWPIDIIAAPERPRAAGASPDLTTAIAMTGADIAQNTLGFTGAGVRVAVMDTGVDYDNGDLGGDGVPRTNSNVFPTARIVEGFDFVGDAFNADPNSPTFNPVSVPDPFPDDCNGHGSHVAGIVGASGELTGVAPGVVFGAYRVFGCDGSTTTDIMLAAMERALADNMDVLNMSIGSRTEWPQSPTGAAATRLLKKGMVVVASIGNNGPGGSAPDGPYAAGAPGVGTDVIGVASYDNSHAQLPYFTVNDQKVGYVPMTFAGPTPTSGTEEIVNIGQACTVDLPLLADPTDKVALASRGVCSFGEKATNAINAGAIAVVISNNIPGVFNGTLGAPIDGVTPVVGISLADGDFIRAETAPVMMTWTDQQDFFESPTGNLISGFSSFGMAADLTLKPDIGAPGGSINSTIPLELGGHGLNSGTSMSSPHVAGAVALLLQAEPNIPLGLVRSRLQNSADPTPWSSNPGLGFLDYAHRQGAGLLDIDDAILATVDVTPGKLSLGESQSEPHTRTLTIRNRGSSDVTFDLSHVTALVSGPKNQANFTAVSTFLAPATVGFSAASVSVPAGGTSSVDVTITSHPGAPDQSQYGGYIVLTPDGGGQIYRVPFAGFKGDYQTVPVITPSSLFTNPADGFPWLAQLVGPSFFNRPAGATYTMVGDDIPFFLVHLDHQSRYYEFGVTDAATGKRAHPVFSNFDQDEFVGRNTTAGGFFAFAWDGTRAHSAGNPNLRKGVPDGSYVVTLRVLKALGDPDNPAHWEVWTSPVVTIDRP